MSNGKGNSGKKFWLVVVILLMTTGSAAWWLKFRKKEEIVTIQTEKVQRRDLTELVVANGRVYPVLQVKISPEVSGEIIELPVKEGQQVKKGDLLLRIKPDFYAASKRSAEASYQAAVANKDLSAANLRKAEIEEARNKAMLDNKLISDSAYLEIKTACDVARSSFRASEHQVNVAKAALQRAEEELAKTTIVSPLTGTVSKLNSQLGERVVGTAMMTGTEVMVIADLNEMEARVDIGEVDVVLIAIGQKARLEVEAFRERKFTGVVTEIANSSRGLGGQGAGGGGGGGGGGQGQEATRFEVKIRINDKETFRPGMSVTAEIETRSRTNVLCVPIQSVTTRLPKSEKEKDKSKDGTNAIVAAVKTTNAPGTDRKKDDGPKPVEVVFLHDGGVVRALPVKRGISDDNYTEITAGLTEGQEVVSGGYKAISRDLEDGKKVKIGDPEKEKDEKK